MWHLLWLPQSSRGLLWGLALGTVLLISAISSLGTTTDMPSSQISIKGYSVNLQSSGDPATDSPLPMVTDYAGPWAGLINNATAAQSE